MATWSDRPTRSNDNQPFKIYRCPANRPLKVICVSEMLIGCDLHYWKGRSVPCSGNECTACQAGQMPRWRGYFQGFSEDSRTVRIIEVTERVWGIFDAATKKHGSLRGLGVRIERMNGKVNGPLSATFEGMMKSPGELPEEADLIAILERMWEHRQGALPGMESESDPQGKANLRAI